MYVVRARAASQFFDVHREIDLMALWYYTTSHIAPRLAAGLGCAANGGRPRARSFE